MILKLTNREALSAPAAGWHSGTVERVDYADNSTKTGKVFNIFLKTDGGQTHKRVISAPTEKNPRSLLELAQLYDVCMGTTLPDGAEFEMNDIVGHALDFEVVYSLYNGSMVPSAINGKFAKHGSALDVPFGG